MIGILGLFAGLNSGDKVVLVGFCRDLDVGFCENSPEFDDFEGLKFVEVHEGMRDWV